MDKGIPVVFASSIDMPVTPPSINLVESRKPFMPMAADNTPATTNIKLSMYPFNFTFKYTILKLMAR